MERFKKMGAHSELVLEGRREHKSLSSLNAFLKTYYNKTE